MTEYQIAQEVATRHAIELMQMAGAIGLSLCVVVLIAIAFNCRK